jgi:hypothetical protein
VRLSTNGLASPASVTGVLCLASNDAGEALVTIPVSVDLRSLLAELTAVRASIAARGQTGNPKSDKAITHALAALDEATAAAGWTDGARLTRAAGRDVFDGSLKAVKELDSIAGPPSWATDAIKTITSLNRELAELAVSEAPAGQAKANAERDLAKGDAERAAGSYANAIVQYRRAWALVAGG